MGTEFVLGVLSVFFVTFALLFLTALAHKFGVISDKWYEFAGYCVFYVVFSLDNISQAIVDFLFKGKSDGT
jgi:hypothetical protein